MKYLLKPGDTVQELSIAEKAKFAKLKSQLFAEMDFINSGFARIGRILREIRDERLYRAEHDSFEAFVKAVLGTRRNYAYRLIAAANMLDELLAQGIGEEELPKSERLLRELAEYPKKHASKIYRGSRDKALASGLDQPTIAMIRKTAAETLEQGREREIKAFLEQLRTISRMLPEAISWEYFSKTQLTNARALLMDIAKRVTLLFKDSEQPPLVEIEAETVPSPKPPPPRSAREAKATNE